MVISELIFEVEALSLLFLRACSLVKYKLLEALYLPWGRSRISVHCGYTMRLQSSVSLPPPSTPTHGGTPKRFPIPRNPIKTLVGKKTKRQLVRHGDYASIASCRTKFPLYFEGYLEFSVGFKSFYVFPFHPLHLWRFSSSCAPFSLRRRPHSSPYARLHPRILKMFFIYNDVNNQQDAKKKSFFNLFNSALHVSGDKFAHHQEHFLTVYTAFGTVHRRCCRPVPQLRWNSISTVAPVGSSVGEMYQKLYVGQKVLLRMGEFVARNM